MNMLKTTRPFFKTVIFRILWIFTYALTEVIGGCINTQRLEIINSQTLVIPFMKEGTWWLKATIKSLTKSHKIQARGMPFYKMDSNLVLEF